MLCLKCGIVISGSLGKAEFHPLCAPAGYIAPEPEPEVQSLFQRSADPSGMSFLEVDVRDALTEIIQWGARSTPRSAQIAVGPSELGTPCDRELAYRLAGVPGPNHSDPWPSVVGTAAHTWFTETVNAFERAHGLKRLQTEVRVQPDPAFGGSTDLWWPEHELVLDMKNPGADGMKKLRTEGFGQRYEVQLMLYGLGHERAGRKVSKVGIFALHRAGWLKDMFVKIVDYDRSVAENAIKRMYKIGDLINKEGILDDPSRWSKIEASPSRLCGFCRMYRTGGPADATGCPGR